MPHLSHQPFHRRIAWRPFVGHLQLWAGQNLSLHPAQRSHRALGCVTRRVYSAKEHHPTSPKNFFQPVFMLPVENIFDSQLGFWGAVSFSDEELFRFTQSANVLHQSVDLVLTQPSPESRHTSSPFSDHASQLRIRLLLNLRRVKIRGM